MIDCNNACPPASFQRFLATEVAPKGCIALVAIAAATALGYLTCFLINGNTTDGLPKHGAFIFFTFMVGVLELTALALVVLGISKCTNCCKQRYLAWREND